MLQFLKLIRFDDDLKWFFLVGTISAMQKEKQNKKSIYEKIKWNWRPKASYNDSEWREDHFDILGGLWMFLEWEKIEF
jgi:hypothetical protein